MAKKKTTKKRSKKASSSNQKRSAPKSNKKKASKKTASCRKKTSTVKKKAAKKKASSTKRKASSTKKKTSQTKRKTAKAKSAKSKSSSGSPRKSSTQKSTATKKSRRASKAKSNKPFESGLPKSPAAPDKTGRSNGDSIGGKPQQPRKTRLTDKDLEEFKELLLAKRRELMGDVADLESEAKHGSGSAGGTGSSSMPIHMADLGSDTWEQELTLGLIENERGLLREIDEALERIDEKTYGICLATGKPITKARLRAQPWAKYCIEYARQRELGLA